MAQPSGVVGSFNPSFSTYRPVARSFFDPRLQFAELTEKRLFDYLFAGFSRIIEQVICGDGQGLGDFCQLFRRRLSGVAVLQLP